MAQSRKTRRVRRIFYRSALLKSISALVDRKAAHRQPSNAERWRPWKLIVAALLMAWDRGPTLAAKFGSVMRVMRELFPRTRLGTSYQGFIKALLAATPLLDWISEQLRAQMPGRVGPGWLADGWCALAVDGSRVECPRTAANEQVLGCAGKKRTTPQLFLTTIYHLGSGLPWAYQIGPGTDSERNHLRAMLGLLPPKALLVADAGFVGYDLLESIAGSGRHFLIRVGSNVTLLNNLGWGRADQEGNVHLWPQKAAQHHKPPMTLRLIRLTDGGKDVYLVSNVFDPQRLSDRLAGKFYRARWGVEVFYRSFKETLGHRRMRSDAPSQARCELAWAVLGLWMLSLMAVQRLRRVKADPLSLSVAGAIGVVRQATASIHRPRQVARLLASLATAVKDGYQRHGPKAARDWPHKKKEKPPGNPKIRPANQLEVQLAKDLEAAHAAA
jgi:hypothetical protein